MKSKVIWSGIVIQYKRTTKGIFLPKPLCVTKARDLKCSFNTAVSLHQIPEPRATFAFYRVSHVLATHENTFKDGNIVKQAFLEAADSLFEHFKNRAQTMKAAKEWKSPAIQGMLKNGYVCGGATEDV